MGGPRMGDPRGGPRTEGSFGDGAETEEGNREGGLSMIVACD